MEYKTYMKYIHINHTLLLHTHHFTLCTMEPALALQSHKIHRKYRGEKMHQTT